MADTDIVAYNIAAFVTALFLLESGAEKFITAIVARRINVSETTIGLLTAGAEWEEVRHHLRTAPFGVYPLVRRVGLLKCRGILVDRVQCDFA